MDAFTRPDVLLFDGFRFDRCSGGLFRQHQDGICERPPIGSRALDVLGMLIDRRGEVVAKAELIDAVWPGTVVEESNLAVQISALRRLLDQGRSGGSCIQTVSGRGYRFVAAVTPVEPTAALGTAPNFDNPQAARSREGLTVASSATAPPARHRSWRVILTSLAAVVLLLVAAAAWNSNPPWLAAARPAPRLSIVVLPFANLNDAPEQQYFVDGITDDLTTDLSRITGSFVISRGTAFTYRNKPVNAKQIGRELGVRYVLEGSVQRLGNQLRVNTQLIDAETDANLWAERFERDTGDLFALQNEITARIGNALSVQLIGAEAARPTADPDALDYILRGRTAYTKGFSRDNYAEAVDLFERALALDPRSVQAKSLLAMVLMSRVLEDMTTSRAADIARAEGLIGQALAASASDPQAHFAKGQMLRAQGHCEEALPEYEAVIASNRNFAAALVFMGRCKMLTGLLDEAIPPMEQAIRLSPRDPGISVWYSQIGLVHLVQSRTDDAIIWLEKSRSANPGRPFAHAWLAAAYGLKGETERAAAELGEARRLSGDGRYSSIARLRATVDFGVPRVRALLGATYLGGLRKAGMPEE